MSVEFPVKRGIALAAALALVGCVSAPEQKVAAEPTKVQAPKPAVQADAQAATEAKAAPAVAAEVPAETPAPAPVPRASGPKPATTPPAASSTTAMPVSESDVRQKIQYADVMVTSKSSKRVAASDNAEAKAQLEQAKGKLTEAKAAIDAGKANEAKALADEAMKLMNNASRLVPSTEMVAEQKARYEGLLKELATAKQSHKQNFDKMVSKKGSSAGVKYDAAQVDKLAADAAALAAKGDYEKAVDAVGKAQTLVNNAISQMLAGQEIRYELNIGTPEGEYKYELDRYKGYEELIPVAMENNPPNEGQKALIKQAVDKGQWMAAEAEKKAKEGDYPMAIRMMMDATEKVRGALKILGINQ